MQRHSAHKTYYLFTLFLVFTVIPAALQAARPKELIHWKADIPEFVRQVDSMRRHGSGLTTRDFVIVGDTLYMSPEGTMYLFRWDDSAKKAVLLGHPKYHGYNFQRYLFSYNHSIYSLGGYGFWHQHSLLTVFNPSSQEWEMVPVKGSVPPGKPTFCSKIGDKIYCFGFAMDNFDSDGDDLRPVGDIYTLDLRNFEWKNTYKTLNEGTTRRLAYLENDDWYVNRTIVIDKKNLVLYSAKLAFPFPQDLSKGQFAYLDGNLVYGAFNVKNDNMRNAPYSLAERISENNIYKLDLKSMNLRKFVHLYGRVIGLVSISMLIAALLLFLRRYRGKNAGSANGEGEVQEILNRFALSGNNIFTTDELDSMLGISHLSSDSRKIKRSQLLKKIEDTHPGMIVRERSSSDKRVFDYRYRPESR